MISSLNFFDICLVKFVNFSCCFKFHVNMITGSGVMTISFYKRLARNLEIGNTPSEFCPISGYLVEEGIQNLARVFLIKCYCMLQNSIHGLRLLPFFSY